MYIFLRKVRYRTSINPSVCLREKKPCSFLEFCTAILFEWERWPPVETLNGPLKNCLQYMHVYFAWFFFLTVVLYHRRITTVYRLVITQDCMFKARKTYAYAGITLLLFFSFLFFFSLDFLEEYLVASRIRFYGCHRSFGRSDPLILTRLWGTLQLTRTVSKCYEPR